MKNNKDIEAEVAARLKKLRKAAELSQQAVGKGVGVTFQQMQKYESGTDRIRLNRLYELSVLFNIPFRDFFEPEIWGREMSDEEAQLILAVRQMKDDEKKAALATILRKTY